MKREDITTMNKNQLEMKKAKIEMKNTLERIKRRLDEAEDRISKLEDKVEKNTQSEQQNEKRLKMHGPASPVSGGGHADLRYRGSPSRNACQFCKGISISSLKDMALPLPVPHLFTT